MFSEKSQWVTCGKGEYAPIIVKNFSLECDFEKGLIDICGLGYYELFVNGRRVGKDFFKPVVSDYSERDFSNFLYPLQDKTSHTVYYNTYDITRFLRGGENTIAVMLGNGFYRQTKRLAEGNTAFNDELILRYELHLTGQKNRQTVCSDGTERIAESFIKENNLFFGETHDYAAFDQEIFQGKNIENLPFVHTGYVLKTKILKGRCPNDKIQKVFKPKLVKTTPTGAIYDVGQNIAGFVRFRAISQSVCLRHAENMKNGELDFWSAGGKEQIYENEYKNAQGKMVHPWFSWGGFRYFEIIGKAENIEACFVHSNVKPRVEFTCGNDTVNWLFEAYLRTQLCNMHGGVPSDCPHRERLGYTGDGQVTAESSMLLLDAREFYKKWMRDLADCQDVKSGHVQHTAPFFGGGGGPGGWGSAIVIVPYTYYKIYGNKKILKKYYQNMLAYLKSMKGFCENNLVVKEREKGWCLGDWCSPEPIVLPEPFVNTFYYIRCMETVEKIAEILGKKEDFSAEISKAKEAFEKEYYQPQTGNFCNGKQGANAYALTLGLGDERTKNNLLAHYKATGVFDTGIFGTDILAEYLVKIGEIQLLFDLLSGEKYPSFGHMKRHGATTLWEAWLGDGSHNHPMFGGCVKQLLYGLLGMQADVGLKNITFAPKFIKGIDFIRMKIRLPRKTVRVNFEYKDDKVFQK